MTKTTDRWAFRVEHETNELVRNAAQAADRSLTEFVVGAAVVQAEHVMADRTRFTLPADQWSRFVDALDRPPRDKPGLRKLFAKRSVFAS